MYFLRKVYWEVVREEKSTTLHKARYLSSFFQVPLMVMSRPAQIKILTWTQLLGGFLVKGCPGVRGECWGLWALGFINHWRSLGRKRGNRKERRFLWRGENWYSSKVEILHEETIPLAKLWLGTRHFHQNLSIKVGDMIYQRLFGASFTLGFLKCS